MKIQQAYNQLMRYNLKFNYIHRDGKTVFDNGYCWIVVFQAMNCYNYAVVKFYNGEYKIAEI